MPFTAQRPTISRPLSSQPSGPIASLRPEIPFNVRQPAEQSTYSSPSTTLTFPAGTPVSIRLGETLSSDRNHSGDNFYGALDQPLVIGASVIADRGDRVEGRITEARTAGRIRGSPELGVELTSFRTLDGQVVAIHTAAYVRRESKGVFGPGGKIGGGAVIGAAVGAMAGAGVGAAIGAGVGSVAGVGSALVTRRKPLVIPVETLLTFRLDQPATVTDPRR